MTRLADDAYGRQIWYEQSTLYDVYRVYMVDAEENLVHALMAEMPIGTPLARVYEEIEKWYTELPDAGV